MINLSNFWGSVHCARGKHFLGRPLSNCFPGDQRETRDLQPNNLQTPAQGRGTNVSREPKATRDLPSNNLQAPTQI